jgi:hypothetical protein
METKGLLIEKNQAQAPHLKNLINLKCQNHDYLKCWFMEGLSTKAGLLALPTKARILCLDSLRV